jgi:signal transduction histidine kinase
MPFVEVGVIAIFILVGFIGFRNIKRAEQRNIWVGMAKETAHQLGTPLSGLMGWLQLLRSRVYEQPEARENEGTISSEEILSRMESDVNRLERIANRFSLIGSRPTLATVDAEDILISVVDYFSRRLPHNGEGVRIEFERSNPKPVSVNSELIGWVFENVIKNALEACDSKRGLVRIKSGFSKDGGRVSIEITDNGKGMSPKQIKKVFQPGYTTKKRGWGLGLALANRIVSEYHRGEIFVTNSAPGRGTTFRIDLPIANPNKKAEYRG